MAAIEELMSIDEQRRLFELRSKQKAAWLEYHAKDREAKAAKKKAESCDKEVSNFLDEYSDMQDRGLFKGNGQAAADTGQAPAFDDAPPAAGQEPAPPVAPTADGEGYDVASDEDRWKAVQVEVLREHGAKPADVAKLKEAGLHTLGDVVNYTKDGEHRLTDVKGIGETANDRIIDAIVACHEANPARAKDVPGTPRDASPGEDVESPDPTPGDAAGSEQERASDTPSPPTSRKRRKKPEPEPETAPDDFQGPPDEYTPPSGEFDPDSDSQRNDHDE